MNKTLDDIKLIDLMPPSIRNDPQVIHACESIEPDMEELKKLIQWTEIYSRIDELPESLIQFLAWENKILGAEWAIAGNLSKRRELVKNSYLLNKLRGTRWSVERIFNILGMRAEIKEWWEENAEPFTFRISLLDITGVGLTKEMEEWVTSLIYAYKPLSRHITATNMVNNLPAVGVKSSVATYFKMIIEE